MAKIREYEQRTQTPTGPSPSFSRAIPFYTGNPEGLQDLGRAVNNAASIKQASDEEHARAWSADVLSRSRLEWTQQFLDRSANAEPGAPEFSPRFIEDFDKYMEKQLETAPTAKAKGFLSARMSELRTMLGERAMEFEAKARIDWRNDQFTNGIDNTAKLMNTDPSQYPVALAEQLAVIDASAMPPIQKSALREKAITGISKAAVWSQVQKSPQAFLDSIGFNAIDPKTGKTRTTSGDLKGITGNMAFDALPFAERKQMLEEAVKLKAQIDGDVERLAKAERERLSAEALKNLWAANADKKLNRAMIEAARPLLSAAEYLSALKMIDAPEGGQKTDPATYRQLQTLIANDDFEGAVKFAFTAHRNGLLSNDHLSSEINRARTQQRQEGPKSEFERSRSYITQSMDPGPLVPDPVGRSRLAEALDTFDRWVLANPKVPESEMAKRAKEIVGQYKMVDLQETILALPNPRNGKFSRSADPGVIMREADAIGREVQRLFDKNEISSATYKEEMAIIARWLNAARKK
jgi:hypothetical protein